MRTHLLRDLESLKKKLLQMGGRVEVATTRAIASLVDDRPELAVAVLQGDREIDQLEIEVEEECLKLLALHQPVAVDLRYVITVLKVNNDLERVGDLAYSIAKRARELSRSDALDIPPGFKTMVGIVEGMLRQSLDALVGQDPAAAREVLSRDDEVDALHKSMFGALQAIMKAEPGKVEVCVQLLSVSRNLERIADLATNISEDVVFLVEGEVIRHGFQDES